MVGIYTQHGTCGSRRMAPSPIDLEVVGLICTLSYDVVKRLLIPPHSIFVTYMPDQASLYLIK